MSGCDTQEQFVTGVSTLGLQKFHFNFEDSPALRPPIKKIGPLTTGPRDSYFLLKR